MSTIETAGALRPGITNTPLDQRSVVSTLADISAIELPFVGQIVYCIETSRHYKITGLKDKQIGTFLVPNAAVDTFDYLSIKGDPGEKGDPMRVEYSQDAQNWVQSFADMPYTRFTANNGIDWTASMTNTMSVNVEYCDSTEFWYKALEDFPYVKFSADGGETWSGHLVNKQEIVKQYAFSGTSNWTDDPTGNNFIRFSADGGETWTGAFPYSGENNIVSAYAASGNADKWYISFADFNYARFSTDGGTTWSRTLNNTFKIITQYSLDDSFWVTLLTDFRYFRFSTNDGSEWTGPLKCTAVDGKRGPAFTFDATGTLAERSQYDDRPKSFAFLATDDGNAYIKNSDASGDWSAPIPFKGDPGEPGEPGANGVVFTPSVSESGDLSWTNDGNLDNPATVNIKGTPGTNGVVFTPSVSESGDLSWTNDGNLDNPATVNIKGAPGSIIENNYLDIEETTNGFLLLPTDTIPVLVEISGNIYPVVGMVKADGYYKIPIAPILASADLSSYTGTWRVWRAGGKEGGVGDITIGENGNWYVNGVDTQKKATGQGSNVIISPTPPTNAYNGLIWVQDSTEQYFNIDPIEVVTSSTEPTGVKDGTIWIKGEEQ